MRESETEVQARRAKLEAFKLEYIEVLEGELGSADWLGGITIERICDILDSVHCYEDLRIFEDLHPHATNTCLSPWARRVRDAFITVHVNIWAPLFVDSANTIWPELGDPWIRSKNPKELSYFLVHHFGALSPFLTMIYHALLATDVYKFGDLAVAEGKHDYKDTLASKAFLKTMSSTVGNLKFPLPRTVQCGLGYYEFLKDSSSTPKTTLVEANISNVRSKEYITRCISLHIHKSLEAGIFTGCSVFNVNGNVFSWGDPVRLLSGIGNTFKRKFEATLVRDTQIRVIQEASVRTFVKNLTNFLKFWFTNFEKMSCEFASGPRPHENSAAGRFGPYFVMDTSSIKRRLGYAPEPDITTFRRGSAILRMDYLAKSTVSGHLLDQAQYGFYYYLHHELGIGPERKKCSLLYFLLNLRSESIEARILRHLEADD